MASSKGAKGAAASPHNSGGSGTSSKPQQGMPGPKSTGGPASLKKALARKPVRTKGL